MMTSPENMSGSADREHLYRRLARSDEFKNLRSRHRSFVFLLTLAFLAWYLLFVVLSNWAPNSMSAKLIGNINVGVTFGLLQFVSTFAIAWWYSSFAAKTLDPLADKVRATYECGDAA
jgi:uncharacterized membrane protein (DUF485 family)